MSCVTKIVVSCCFAILGVVCWLPAQGYSSGKFKAHQNDLPAVIVSETAADSAKGPTPSSTSVVVMHDDRLCDPLVFTRDGSYSFTHCKTGQQITGKGRVRVIGATITLTDRESDRSRIPLEAAQRFQTIQQAPSDWRSGIGGS